MAYIDNELLFFNDTTSAASMTSTVIDLGEAGATTHPLYIDAKLTHGLTSGSLSTITVQSASTAAFGSPVTEMSVTIPATVVQTAPATLAQFFSPIKPQNRYVRLTIAGTSPTGGKVTAFMAAGATVRL